jgi:hypothetical protein
MHMRQFRSLSPDVYPTLALSAFTVNPVKTLGLDLTVNESTNKTGAVHVVLDILYLGE